VKKGVIGQNRLWARIERVWVTLGIAATTIFVGWSLIAYRASAEARAAARSDAAVGITREDGIWHFNPANHLSGASTGLLFFPGALVDPTAYAPLARAVAAAGYHVIIVELPRRGAFGGAKDPDLLIRATEQMRRADNPRRWVIAGHSRGAVVATELAATQTVGIAGLVLVGTTHPRDVDLSRLAVPVTKVVGTRDGIAPLKKALANRHLLPAATRWVRIEGGNHSQFGWYGFQPGDRFAKIEADSQRASTIAAILDMLRTTAPQSPAISH
jgi:pimeloyl-ACP methyl ester carboxylesterase